ncbi:hypothetical protein VNO78_30667 [Psophocarpus tetragonolobus]|uniref:Uncharacterized protein n=1 Tax=Psophocarpus tetragonolobus TaxID=3891 RepID=A0AAN9RX23_PSOTE
MVEDPPPSPTVILLSTNTKETPLNLLHKHMVEDQSPSTIFPSTYYINMAKEPQTILSGTKAKRTLLNLLHQYKFEDPSTTTTNAIYATIIYKVKELILRNLSIELLHVFCEENQVVDVLAKKRTRGLASYVLLLEPPNDILYSLQADFL